MRKIYLPLLLFIFVFQNHSAQLQTVDGEGSSQAVYLKIINAKKIYKGKYFSIEQWPKLVEMFEAAYDFSQSKIILQKQ